MTNRGEADFLRMPSLGARLYDLLTRMEAIDEQFHDVALDLSARVSRGRLLDVGTGPGRLLGEIHRLRPDLRLFGLDISQAMVNLARQNLSCIEVDLRQGSVRQTEYPDGFFHAITCTGSFYLWDEPERCLEEIQRILIPGHSAYLYETYQDYDRCQFKEALQANLQGESWLRRVIAPRFLEQQFKMTYRRDELEAILRDTSFADRYQIDPIILGGLPVWIRIQLTKARPSTPLSHDSTFYKP